MTIESINYHLEQGKGVEQAIMDGASQIVDSGLRLPAVHLHRLRTRCSSSGGVARFLFVPMAESVMFAMVFSFLLSRTLVPTMAKYLLRLMCRRRRTKIAANGASGRAIPWCAFSTPSRHASPRCATGITSCSASRSSTAACSSRVHRIRCGLVPAGAVSRAKFFPQVDGGQILLHVRAPVGMRIEETAARFGDVEKAIRRMIPPAEMGAVVDNIGTYLSSINTIYNNTGTISESDGDIQISLNEGHAPTAGYVSRLREELPRRFPGMTFSFLPADIVSQILNFGAPAPIDLQVRGNDLGADFRLREPVARQDTSCHRRGRCAHPAISGPARAGR